MRLSSLTPSVPRPEEVGSPTKASIPPPYSLSHIYAVLSRLGALSHLLQNLRVRILRHIVHPVVNSGPPNWRVRESKADTISELRLESSIDSPTPSDVLSDVSTILSFVTSTIFPPTTSSTPERNAFLFDLQTAVFQAVLESVILPAMPVTLASVPTWLDVVQQASEFETALIGTTSTPPIIAPFFELAAGPAWAAQRRRRVAEEVRRLVLGGWGGWEAIEAEREKEVVVMEEVEIEDEDALPDQEMQERADLKNDNPTFDWGFDDDESSLPERPAMPEKVDEPMEADPPEVDAWGFDDNPAAGPSRPRQDSAEDGWEFDDVSAPASARPIAAAPKPAREAKRLGKKVAKVKSIVEEDVWGAESGSESTEPPGQNGHSPAEVDDWGGWAEEETAKPGKEPTRPRKKVLREQRRKIKESFLVSRACDKLLEMAERVLREAQDLRSTR